MATRIVITGANGSVGTSLLAHAAAEPAIEVVPVVRSERAAETVRRVTSAASHVVSYDDIEALAEVMRGADSVVHLPGILIETKHSTYEHANVTVTANAVEACRRAGVGHFVLVSVIGADAGSSNRYFRTKGEGERVVSESGLDATILRTSMLLGPGSAGAQAITRTASQRRTKLMAGGRYKVHPLDQDDLSRAILTACKGRKPGVHLYELAGPESLTFRELIERTAKRLGHDIAIRSVPVWVAKAGAAILSRVKGSGVTPAVIDVITADEVADLDGAERLGITLTPLDATLSKILTTAGAEPEK